MLRRLVSLKFTLAGMVLLAGGAMLSYGNPVDTSVWVVLLALNNQFLSRYETAFPR